MQYQEKVDQLFKGSQVANPSLRMLFDCFSDDWENTNIVEKEELLMKLYLSEEPIAFYVKGYVNHYTADPANEAKVLDALSKSIRMLIMNIKDDLIRASLLKIYVDLSKD